jgi:hypothetical protein
MLKTLTVVISIGLVLGCGEKEEGISFGGDALFADTDANDANPGADEDCASYRSAYPSGPYGYGAGSVLEDLPGMVDGSGTAQSLVDTFTDRTKMALVLSNAFET